MGVVKHHKSEGGQGGRRGHSNMDHWVTTGEIKDAARKIRRRQARAVVAKELSDANASELASGHFRSEKTGREYCNHLEWPFITT